MPKIKAPVAPRVVSREKWTAARVKHLANEKKFNRLRDRLSAERRKLPWVKIEENYVFDTPEGKRTLSELFDGRNQLIVYHFMFGPGWDEGCRGCSYVADHFNADMQRHLNARDVTLVAASKAPLKEFMPFKKRMGWTFTWASANANTFNHDFGVSWTKKELKAGKIYYNYAMRDIGMEELPGASVFAKNAAGEIFHTYSTYSRGLDMLLGAYHFMDLVPKGRDEAQLDPSMSWVKHHDKY